MNDLSPMHIRPMIAQDWPQVQRIYAEGIATGIATFETDVPTWEHFDAHHLVSPRLIAAREATVLGWAVLSAISHRAVYRGVAEVSIYIGDGARGQGVGKTLLNALIVASEQAGLWMLQATILGVNETSIALHRKCGFRVVGTRERISHFRGRWHDTIIMERRSAVVGV